MLGFPGLFKGALMAGVSCFTDNMLFAAASTLASLAGEHKLVPDPLDRAVHDAVTAAVHDTALRDLELH